jgi:DNA repair photolyase
MNIYKGCCHDCIYCESRSECYRVENFDEVRAKENALELVERDWRMYIVFFTYAILSNLMI